MATDTPPNAHLKQDLFRDGTRVNQELVHALRDDFTDIQADLFKKELLGTDSEQAALLLNSVIKDLENIQLGSTTKSPEKLAKTVEEAREKLHGLYDKHPEFSSDDQHYIEERLNKLKEGYGKADFKPALTEREQSHKSKGIRWGTNIGMIAGGAAAAVLFFNPVTVAGVAIGGTALSAAAAGAAIWASSAVTGNVIGTITGKATQAADDAIGEPVGKFTDKVKSMIPKLAAAGVVAAAIPVAAAIAAPAIGIAGAVALGAAGGTAAYLAMDNSGAAWGARLGGAAGLGVGAIAGVTAWKAALGGTVSSVASAVSPAASALSAIGMGVSSGGVFGMAAVMGAGAAIAAGAATVAVCAVAGGVIGQSGKLWRGIDKALHDGGNNLRDDRELRRTGEVPDRTPPSKPRYSDLEPGEATERAAEAEANPGEHASRLHSSGRRIPTGRST